MPMEMSHLSIMARPRRRRAPGAPDVEVQRLDRGGQHQPRARASGVQKALRSTQSPTTLGQAGPGSRSKIIAVAVEFFSTTEATLLSQFTH